MKPFNSPSDTDESHSNVRICCWNINGLSQYKLSDDISGNFLNSFDIILLSETWATNDDVFEMEGFTFHNYARQMKHCDARRNSGGLGIFTWNDIAEGVQLLKHTKDIIAWLRLDKGYFGLDTDLYIANLYIVPIGSTHLTDDPFAIVNDDLTQLPDCCQILICGDCNARTGIRADYNVDDTWGSNGDLSSLLPDNDITYSHRDVAIGKFHSRKMLTRYSQYGVVNTHGKRLLGTCMSSGLLIMNGRLGYDVGVGGIHQHWLHG